MLSGFVISLVASKGPKAHKFLFDRLARIVPLYWAVTFISYFIAIFFDGLVSSSTVAATNWLALIKSLFFLPYYGVEGIAPIVRMGWTLNYEIYFYFCVALSLLFSRNGSALLSQIIIGVVFFSCMKFSDGVVRDFYSNDIVFEFLYGVFLHRFFLGSWNFSLRVWLLVMLAAIIYFIFVEIEDFPRAITWGLPSAFLCLGFIKINNQINWDCGAARLFVKLGDASYATYLSHWLVISAIRRIYAIIIDENSFGGFIFFALAFILCHIVGYIIYIYFDRPSSSWLKKVGKSWIK